MPQCIDCDHYKENGFEPSEQLGICCRYPPTAQSGDWRETQWQATHVTGDPAVMVKVGTYPVVCGNSNTCGEYRNEQQ